MTRAPILGLRDGREVKADVPRAVHGDIAVLGTGDVVPAVSGEPENQAKSCKLKFEKPSEPEKLSPDNRVVTREQGLLQMRCGVQGGQGHHLRDRNVHTSRPRCPADCWRGWRRAEDRGLRPP